MNGLTNNPSYVPCCSHTHRYASKSINIKFWKSGFVNPYFGIVMRSSCRSLITMQGLDTSWHSYKVISPLLHRGERPNNGHYVAMFTFLDYLMIDDDNQAWTLPVVDHVTYDDSYLLWLIHASSSRATGGDCLFVAPSTERSCQTF